MQAVLYVGHGSRVKAGANEAISFINGHNQALMCQFKKFVF